MPIKEIYTEGSGKRKLIFQLTGANLCLTTDQLFEARQSGYTSYTILEIIAKVASGGATGTCAGRICTGANKTGNILVAATQNWVTLSATNKILKPTLAALNNTDAQTASPILSLTTGSTGAVTADIFIYGVLFE